MCRVLEPIFLEQKKIKDHDAKKKNVLKVIEGKWVKNRFIKVPLKIYVALRHGINEFKSCGFKVISPIILSAKHKLKIVVEFLVSQYALHSTKIISTLIFRQSVRGAGHYQSIKATQEQDAW